VVEISPTVELPPVTPLTCHVTAVFVLPLTVPVNGCVARVANVAVLGEIVTLTCARAQSGSKAKSTAIATKVTNAVVFEFVVAKDEFVIVFLSFFVRSFHLHEPSFFGCFKSRDGRSLAESVCRRRSTSDDKPIVPGSASLSLQSLL
jgi:hypothetical protein